MVFYSKRIDAFLDGRLKLSIGNQHTDILRFRGGGIPDLIEFCLVAQ